MYVNCLDKYKEPQKTETKERVCVQADFSFTLNRFLLVKNTAQQGLANMTQTDVLSTDVLSSRTFCPPDILSNGYFVQRTFCPHGRFVRLTFCRYGRFVPTDVLSLRTFCPRTFCLRTFCLRTFCLGTNPPTWMWAKNAAAVTDVIHIKQPFYDFGCFEALNRHNLTFFEGYITQDLDSAEVFCGIGICCQFFALKDFLSYRPLKKMWADPPTAVRFRVKTRSFVRCYCSYT